MPSTLPIARFVSLGLCCLFAGAGCSPAPAASSPDMSMSAGRPPPAASVALFDESAIQEWNVVFTDADWTTFMNIHTNGPDPKQAKQYVHCQFGTADELHPDAACYPRGNPANWPMETMPQFVVRFDYWSSTGRFHGLSRIELYAKAGVAAPIRNRAGLSLMRDLGGVYAPRANSVKLSRNGTYLGVYENVEAVDQDYLAWQFADGNGNLYEGGSKLATNTKANDTSRLTMLDNLAANEPLDGDHTAFFTALAGMMNVSEMLKERAGEAVLPTGAAWSNNGTNYDLYDDPTSKQFLVIPTGVETLLDMDSPPNADPYAFWGMNTHLSSPNKFLQLVDQKPEWKAEFQSDLASARDGAYQRLLAYIDAACAQIRPAIAAAPMPYGTPAQMDADCADMKSRIMARTTFLKTTLGR